MRQVFVAAVLMVIGSSSVWANMDVEATQVVPQQQMVPETNPDLELLTVRPDPTPVPIAPAIPPAAPVKPNDPLKQLSSLTQADMRQWTTPHGFSIPWSNDNTPCWDQAGAYHGVDPWLLYAIAKKESSHNPDAINRSNRNGTVDVGLMQINSVHFPTLRRYGIPREALHNACASTFIGAWVLSNNFKRFGRNWQAVAAYNVGSLNTPGRRATGERYARDVFRIYQELVARHRGATVSAR